MKRQISLVLLALLVAPAQADDADFAREALRGIGDAVLSLWNKESPTGKARSHSTLIGGQPPPISLPFLLEPAQTLTEAALKNGTVTVLNFWASWCVPCKAEHRQLMRLAKLDGVQVVGVNSKDQRSAALSFIEGLGDPFAIIGSDEEGRTAIDFGVLAFPESFVIAGDGTILYKHVGPILPADLDAHILPAIEAARTRLR